VAAEIFPSSLCVLRQGGVENRLKVKGSGSCIRNGGHRIITMSDVESGSKGRGDDSRSEAFAAEARAE
jgi:hypothetical protein